MSLHAPHLLALVRAVVAGEAPPPLNTSLVNLADGPWGALVRLRAGAETLGFAGRVTPGADLAATIAEAARMAAREDARFGPAGRAGERAAGGEVQVDLFLVRPGGAVEAASPLQPGEGVRVRAGHRRAALLPEGRSPEEVLRRACIAAGLHPEAWRRGGVEIERLEVVPVRDSRA